LRQCSDHGIETHNLKLELKYDNARQYYLCLNASELEDRNLPPVFINVIRKNKKVECLTLDLRKRSQKISDSHTEVLLMSDKAIQDLITEIRVYMSVLFKVSESIAMLDVLSAFAHNVTLHDYTRPRITQTLGIKAGRHPIREKIQGTPFIPNDVFAAQQSRFQIITGCNMSGKSTYIRSIALLSVMAQIGCFVPADFASFPIIKSLFARISIDDSIEANVSTFASEMRETAFILRNIDKHSLVIIDELGRGTSPRDGLAIALAIAEAMVESRALVWFATHFRDLAKILSERNGVINRHLAVDMSETNTMSMLYTLTDGVVSEQHYGLQLAEVMPLPPDVLIYATQVAEALQAQVERRKQASKAVILGEKRKLILGLKEELSHVCGGVMEGVVLQSWLQQLQREFEVRMVAIEQEANKADLESLALDEEMEDFETVTNDTGSVIHRDGNSLTSNHDSESMIEDDSNMTDGY
jgi:DNA mismatch repair protein MSH4